MSLLFARRGVQISARSGNEDRSINFFLREAFFSLSPLSTPFVYNSSRTDSGTHITYCTCKLSAESEFYIMFFYYYPVSTVRLSHFIRRLRFFTSPVTSRIASNQRPSFAHLTDTYFLLLIYLNSRVWGEIINKIHLFQQSGATRSRNYEKTTKVQCGQKMATSSFNLCISLHIHFICISLHTTSGSNLAQIIREVLE